MLEKYLYMDSHERKEDDFSQLLGKVIACKDNLNVYLERNDWMTWLGNLKKTKLFTQNYSNYAGNLSAKSPK